MTDLLICRDQPLPADAELTALVTLYTTIKVADYLDEPGEQITLDELCLRMGGSYSRAYGHFVTPDGIYSHLKQHTELHVDEITWEPAQPNGDHTGARFEKHWETYRRDQGDHQRIGRADYVTFTDATRKQVA